MDLSMFQDLLAKFGLDAGLYGTAVALALTLRFARAYWKWCDDGHTFGVGSVLGLGGAALFLTMTPRPWQGVLLQGISLTVVVLLGERLLRSQAGKFGLPHDNEWTDDHQPVPPPANQGGFMRISMAAVLAAVILLALAVPALAVEKSLADPSRLSCGFQAGATWMTARATENDYELSVAVNPTWNLGTLPAAVAPLKVGLLTRQFSWEPRLSVLAYDGATAQVFLQGGYGFYSDLDDDAGIEFTQEPVLSAVLVVPVGAGGRWAVVGNGSMRTRSEQRSVSAMLSYLVGGGE